MEHCEEFKEFRDKLGVPPAPAGEHFKDFLGRKGVSENAASKVMGCASSTVNRLCNGGSLTAEMAAKIQRHCGLEVEFMFNLEAQYNTYKAEQLLNQLT